MKTLKTEKKFGENSRIAATDEYLASSFTCNEITLFSLNDDNSEITLALEEIEDSSDPLVRSRLLGFDFTPSGRELVGLVSEQSTVVEKERNKRGWLDLIPLPESSPSRFRLILWNTANWNRVGIIDESATIIHEHDLPDDGNCAIRVINTSCGLEVIWPVFQGKHIAFWNVENQALRFSAKEVTKIL